MVLRIHYKYVFSSIQHRVHYFTIIHTQRFCDTCNRCLSRTDIPPGILVRIPKTVYQIMDNMWIIKKTKKKLTAVTMN